MRMKLKVLSTALIIAALTAAGAPGGDRVSPFPDVKLKGPEESAIWQIEPPVLTANTTDDLSAVQRWSDSITRQVPVVLGGTPQTRAAYNRIMEPLFEWAGADAVQRVSGERTRSVVPRRLLGGITAYLAVKPIADATSDIRRPAIERWILAKARQARATFGGPAGQGRENSVLDYNNNLQAAAATLAMEAYIITGDISLRDWAIGATREVLDEFDEQGFTNEIRRENPEAAEYFSHETMIYVVATANMAKNNGDPSLWAYVGRHAGASREPAIFRAGALLGRDMGGQFVTKLIAEKTGHAQQPYRHSYLVTPGAGGLLIPEGWLTCWAGPFLAEYQDHANSPDLVRLRQAQDYYRKNRISQYNGNVPLLPVMAYPHALPPGTLAHFSTIVAQPAG